MNESVDTTLNSRELSKLDLAGLVRFGEQELKAAHYRRASSLLREAVRRAPFRQDLRELMAAAIEGAASLEPEPMPEPQPRTPIRETRFQPEPVRETPPQATPPPSRGVRPRRIHPQPEFFGEVEQEPPEPMQETPQRLPDPYELETDPAPAPMHFNFERPAEEPARPEPPRAAGRPIAFGRRPAAHRIEPARRGAPKPAQFTKRHNRGPVSALLLAVVVALAFIAAAAGGIYYYMQQAAAADASTPSASPNERYESDYELVTTYKNDGRLSQAIEVLQKLPETPRRNHMLAEIFIAQVDVSLAKRPPALENALDSIKQAVHYYPEKADYGMLLGEVYFSLGRATQQKDAKVSRQHMLDARKAYEAVVKQHPDNLKALLKLGDVAGALGDAVAQANAYDKVILINPSSDEADTARRNKRSLNYRN
ncbi:MAG: tetratricopeptide repeat protein [Candidatus Sumerlaeia bacterium]